MEKKQISFWGPGAVFGQPLPSKEKVVSQSKILQQNMKPAQTKNQAWTVISMNNPVREKPTQFEISKKTKKVGLHSKISKNMTLQTQVWTPWMPSSVSYKLRTRKLNGIKVKKNKNIKKCLAWSCMVLFLIGLCVLLGFMATNYKL